MDEGDNPQANLAASDAHDPAILQALVTGNQAIGAMPPNTYKQVLEAYEAANPGKPAALRLRTLPERNVTRSSNIGGRMLVINANTKYPEAAWKFVKYMASEAVFSRLLPDSVSCPALAAEEGRFRTRAQRFAEQLGICPHLGRLCERPCSDRHLVEC